MFEHETYAGKAANSFFSHFEYAHAKLPTRSWLEWEEQSKQYKNSKAFSIFCDRISADPDSQIYISARDVRDILPNILMSPSASQAFFDGCSVSDAHKLCSNQKERLDQFLKTAQLLFDDYQDIDLKQLTQKQHALLMGLHQLTSNLLFTKEH